MFARQHFRHALANYSTTYAVANNDISTISTIAVAATLRPDRIVYRLCLLLSTPLFSAKCETEISCKADTFTLTAGYNPFTIESAHGLAFSMSVRTRPQPTYRRKASTLRDMRRESQSPACSTARSSGKISRSARSISSSSISP